MLSHEFAQIGQNQGIIFPDLHAPIAISLGAIVGALSRYYLTLLSMHWFGTAFPYGTLLINLTGSGLIGFLVTGFTRFASLVDLQWLIVTGFLGSYTTFSTYALDTSNLLRTQNYKNTLLYGWGSLVLGLVSVEFGILFANLLFNNLFRSSFIR